MRPTQYAVKPGEQVRWRSSDGWVLLVCVIVRRPNMPKFEYFKIVEFCVDEWVTIYDHIPTWQEASGLFEAAATP